MKQKYGENEEESDSSSSESEDEDAEVQYSVSVVCCHICDVISTHVEISRKYKGKQVIISKPNLVSNTNRLSCEPQRTPERPQIAYVIHKN